MLGNEKNFFVFKASDEPALRKKMRDILKPCKISLDETIKLDDEDNTGNVSLEGILETFEIMELEFEDRLLQYIIFLMFKNAKDIDHLKYKPLFDVIDEKEEKQEEKKASSEMSRPETKRDESYGDFSREEPKEEQEPPEEEE